MYIPNADLHFFDTSAVAKIEQIFAPVHVEQLVESIGKRYRRQDEIGTPLCITIDFDTLEDGTVTVRDRDSMEQIRLPISELEAYIEKTIEF